MKQWLLNLFRRQPRPAESLSEAMRAFRAEESREAARQKERAESAARERFLTEKLAQMAEAEQQRREHEDAGAVTRPPQCPRAHVGMTVE